MQGSMFCRGLTVFANATVMRSQIRLGRTPTAATTNHAAVAMVGQAPYVLNAGLTCTPAGPGREHGVLLTTVGERIAWRRPVLPDVVEPSRGWSRLLASDRSVPAARRSLRPEEPARFAVSRPGRGQSCASTITPDASCSWG